MTWLLVSQSCTPGLHYVPKICLLCSSIVQKQNHGVKIFACINPQFSRSRFVLRISLKESFLVIKCKLICRKPKKAADQKHSSQPCKLTFDMIFVFAYVCFYTCSYARKFEAELFSRGFPVSSLLIVLDFCTHSKLAQKRK